MTWQLLANHLLQAQSHKDECMYAHAGVVSAATAILLDMEEKGLLKASCTDEAPPCMPVEQVLAYALISMRQGKQSVCLSYDMLIGAIGCSQDASIAQQTLHPLFWRGTPWVTDHGP